MIRFTIVFVLFLMSSLNSKAIDFKVARAAGAPEFSQVLSGYNYQFPKDLYSHDDFRIEWWYYTGNLQEKGTARHFGYQLTFFRVALDKTDLKPNPSKWKVDHVYFAHMTLTDISGEKFHYYERINRQGIGNAGASSESLMVWNEDWSLKGKDNKHLLEAVESGTGIKLQLIPVKELVVHGENGISKKGSDSGNASHYFSYTRMETSGSVFIDGKTYNVFGTSWMDHEFSSNQLNDKLSGWDWFSLKLDDQTELMLYRLRRRGGGIDSFSSGTFVSSNGISRHITRDEFKVKTLTEWKSKQSGITYPAGWEIDLPSLGIRLTLSPDLHDQELYNLRSISASYWEGSVSAEGTVRGNLTKGKGYVELVGYGKALMQDLPD